MRRIIVTILLIFGCFLLQSTVGNILPFSLYKPNFLLILTATFGLIHGKRSGVLIGFFSGLLIDLFYGNVIGLNALIYMYIGFFNGCLYQLFFDDDIKVIILFTAVSDFMYNIIFYIVQFAMRQRLDFLSYFRTLIIPEIISTVIVAIFLYKLFYLINQRLVKQENEERESPWLIR